jgi:Zn finger protein HypA/HybF involved in hydrogenase expression
MDLANMRMNRVRSLAVSCEDCRHNAVVNVDAFPGHLAVKSFEQRFYCTKCESRRIDVRPNWHEAPQFRVLPK